MSVHMLWYIYTQYSVRESSPVMDSRVASCRPAFLKSKNIVRALKFGPRNENFEISRNSPYRWFRMICQPMTKWGINEMNNVSEERFSISGSRKFKRNYFQWFYALSIILNKVLMQYFFTCKYFFQSVNHCQNVFIKNKKFETSGAFPPTI